MLKIDTSSPVMITGATGYVAGWIIKGLLENGVTVHAAHVVDLRDCRLNIAGLIDTAAGRYRRATENAMEFPYALGQRVAPQPLRRMT